LRESHDAAWKEALQVYFQPFLQLFFPAIADDVDWSRGCQFLHNELGQVVREAGLGRRHADVLVRVRRRGGQETWVLVHVEVQSQRDADFERRMWVYHYRIQDRYACPVVGLAVLADANPGWRPDSYRSELWGCEVQVRFPTAKLTDYVGDLEALERSSNPFALLVAAHLHAQRAGSATRERFFAKLRLVRGLYDRGLSRKEVLDLFRCLDWFMALSPQLNKSFREELIRLEEEKKMPYVTSIEKLGRLKGRKEGRAQGRREGRAESLIAVLEARFGPVPEALAIALASVDDDRRLHELLQAAALDQTIDEFVRRLG
jgi:hypothetical protein